jgi:hypothetical protein
MKRLRWLLVELDVYTVNIIYHNVNAVNIVI